ncbi:hypothetical protein PR048_008798 [Dryococelus australis]|uniref:Uncharacterized protein n=1 Tax=Dryococelus australis TaxID=614101 RepID=A0ABQ9HZ57_9NEOP|nr:hypothetical protein PR048_008798 [Dryococelus australis]
MVHITAAEHIAYSSLAVATKQVLFRPAVGICLALRCAANCENVTCVIFESATIRYALLLGERQGESHLTPLFLAITCHRAREKLIPAADAAYGDDGVIPCSVAIAGDCGISRTRLNSEPPFLIGSCRCAAVLGTEAARRSTRVISHTERTLVCATRTCKAALGAVKCGRVERFGRLLTTRQADEGFMRWKWSSTGMKGTGEREIPEKTRRPAAFIRHDYHLRKCGSEQCNRSATAASSFLVIARILLNPKSHDDIAPLTTTPPSTSESLTSEGQASLRCIREVRRVRALGQEAVLGRGKCRHANAQVNYEKKGRVGKDAGQVCREDGRSCHLTRVQISPCCEAAPLWNTEPDQPGRSVPRPTLATCGMSSAQRAHLPASALSDSHPSRSSSRATRSSPHCASVSQWLLLYGSHFRIRLCRSEFRYFSTGRLHFTCEQLTALADINSTPYLGRCMVYREVALVVCTVTQQKTAQFRAERTGLRPASVVRCDPVAQAVIAAGAVAAHVGLGPNKHSEVHVAQQTVAAVNCCRLCWSSQYHTLRSVEKYWPFTCMSPGSIMLLWNAIAAVIDSPIPVPDFNPQVFYSWGHLKALAYATSVEYVGTLRNRIVAGCETIKTFPGIHQRIRVSIQRRVDACCEVSCIMQTNAAMAFHRNMTQPMGHITGCRSDDFFSNVDFKSAHYREQPLSMEQRRNARAEETPASNIVRRGSHLRKSVHEYNSVSLVHNPTRANDPVPKDTATREPGPELMKTRAKWRHQPQNVGMPLPNQSLVTYSPVRSPANREPFVARSSQSEAWPIPRVTRSRPEHGYAHITSVALESSLFSDWLLPVAEVSLLDRLPTGKQSSRFPPTRTVFGFRRGRSSIFSSENRVGRRRWSKSFLGISRFPYPCIPALLHNSPRFALIGSQDLLHTPAAHASKNSPVANRMLEQHFCQSQRALANQTQGPFPEARAANQRMSMSKSKRAEEIGDPRENPPTNGIVRHDSLLRKSGDPAGARSLHQEPVPLGSPMTEVYREFTTASLRKTRRVSPPKILQANVEKLALRLTMTELFSRLAQSSPSTVTADNQCAVDIGTFVHKTVESSVQVIEIANFSDVAPQTSCTPGHVASVPVYTIGPALTGPDLDVNSAMGTSLAGAANRLSKRLSNTQQLRVGKSLADQRALAVANQTQAAELARPHQSNRHAIYFMAALNGEVIEVSMERCRNERAGEAADPRENPPTDGIVRHDSHKRKSGVTRPRIEPGSSCWEASRLTAQPPWSHYSEWRYKTLLRGEIKGQAAPGRVALTASRPAGNPVYRTADRRGGESAAAVLPRNLGIPTCPAPAGRQAGYLSREAVHRHSQSETRRSVPKASHSQLESEVEADRLYPQTFNRERRQDGNSRLARKHLANTITARRGATANKYTAEAPVCRGLRSLAYSAEDERDMRINSLIASTRKALNWRVVLPSITRLYEIFSRDPTIL